MILGEPIIDFLFFWCTGNQSHRHPVVADRMCVSLLKQRRVADDDLLFVLVETTNMVSRITVVPRACRGRRAQERKGANAFVTLLSRTRPRRRVPSACDRLS